MSIENFPRNLTPLEYAAIVDAAKLGAVELRREAIVAFWSAVGRGLSSAWRAIRSRMPRTRIHSASKA